MRDSIELAETGKMRIEKILDVKKFFFFYPAFMPEMNLIEATITSWLFSRGIATKKKRNVEIHNNAQYESVGMEFDDSKKPIDSWWISCSDRKIKKTFPFMSENTIRNVIQKMRTDKIIETKAVLNHNTN